MGFIPFIDFIAGFCAGCSQLIVGQPLDFIKTNIQASKTKKTIVESFKQIYHNYGIRGFYRGSSSMFMGIGAAIAMEFSVYQYIKRLCREYLGIGKDDQLPIPYVGIAGFGVGFVISSLYCPIEYAKIHQQTQKDSKYRGSFHALWNLLFQKEGIKKLYSGYLAIAARDMPGCYIYYASYEWILLYCSPERSQASVSHYLTAGSLAGISYWIYSYPFDSIKTKIQSGQTYSQVFHPSTFSIMSLFRGFSVVLARAIPVNAVNFLVYESVQKYLKNHKYFQ